MKLIIASLLLAVAPQWLFMSIDEKDSKKNQEEVVVVLSGEVGGPCVKVGGDGDEKSVVIMASADAEANDGRSEHKVVKKCIKLGQHGDADRGWLGVSIGEVPEAVEAQIDIDDEGIIILNVLTDSPADKAGLKAHDIIISIDGEEVGAQVGRAVGVIGTHKVGEEVDVNVLREGEEKTFVVTLGSRGDQPTFEWKFAVPPLAEIEEELRTHGRMMTRDDDGKWVLKDLGDLSILHGLPLGVRQFIPRAGTRSIRIWGDEDNETTKTTIRCTVHEDNGAVIVVEQKDGGELMVERIDTDGMKTTATYATEDELRDADAEAFELYSKSGKSVTIDLDIDGLHDFDLDLSDLHLDGLDLGDIDIDLDLDDLGENLTQWQEHLEVGLEKYEEALAEFRERIEQWKEGQHLPELPFGAGEMFTAGKAKHSFEARDDGKIEIRTRKGDSELVRTYSDEADLRERDPKLYEKYRELMTAED